MSSALFADLVILLRQDAVSSALAHSLNATMSGRLQWLGVIPRQLTQPLAPSAPEVKVWWEQPSILLSADERDGPLQLVIPLHGGARSRATQRIVTLGGRIGLARKPRLTINDGGAPVVSLDPPEATGLRLQELQIAYGGAPLPAFVRPQVDFTPEYPLLIPLILTELLRPLTRAPITYLPTSFSLHLPSAAPSQLAGSGPARAAAEAGPPYTIRASAAQARVIRSGHAPVLALSLALDPGERGGDVASSTIPAVFGPPTGSNATRENVALVISSGGMNQLLAQMGAQGALRDVLVVSGASHAGSWESLRVQFHPSVIVLSGQLALDSATYDVEARLASAIDDSGRLVVTALSVTGFPAALETRGPSLASALWHTILLRLLAIAQTPGGASDAVTTILRLRQRFVIPGADVSVEADAQQLLVEEGTVTLLYALPRATDPFLPQPPDLAPQVTITQLGTPVQAAPGAPISVTVEARIVGIPLGAVGRVVERFMRPFYRAPLTPPLPPGSYPPYDFLWSNDLVPARALEHGFRWTFTTAPLMSGAPGARTILTTARVTVVDSFGQFAQAAVPVWYQFAHQRGRQLRPAAGAPGTRAGANRRAPRRALIGAALGFAATLVVGSGALLAAYELWRGTLTDQESPGRTYSDPTFTPTDTATPTATPTTTPTAPHPNLVVSQNQDAISECIGGATYMITIDNLSGNVPVTWQFVPTEYSDATPWAHSSPPSGTLAAGQGASAITVSLQSWIQCYVTYHATLRLSFPIGGSQPDIPLTARTYST